MANGTRAVLLALAFALALPARAFNVYLSAVPPWAVEQNGVQSGINVQLVHELGRRSALPLQPVIVPTNRHVVTFREAKAAFSLSLVTNFSDRDGAIIGYAGSYRIVLVTRREDAAPDYDTLLNRRRLRIGILRGLHYAPVSDDPRVQLAPQNTLEEALGKLLVNRLDAVVASEPAILSAARQVAQSERLAPPLVLGQSTWALRARPDTPKPVAAAVGAALDAMNRDGTLARLVDTALKELTRTPAP